MRIPMPGCERVPTKLLLLLCREHNYRKLSMKSNKSSTFGKLCRDKNGKEKPLFRRMTKQISLFTDHPVAASYLSCLCRNKTRQYYTTCYLCLFLIKKFGYFVVRDRIVTDSSTCHFYRHNMILQEFHNSTV